MPPRRKVPAESPDPLLIYEIIEPIADEIVLDGPPEPPAKPPPSKRPRITKSVESSPIRPSHTPAKPTSRTPLSRSIANKETPARATPTRSNKSQVTPIGATATVTPARGSSRPRATLGSSAKNALPTPSRSTVKPEAIRTPTKRRAVNPNTDKDVDPFGGDNVTGGTTASPASAAISRETFLANEALKRQREARNFKYNGDTNAPRQTRSGRVVREVDAEGVDEFGEMDIEPAYEAEAEEEEEVEVIEEPMDVVEEAGSGRGPRWNNEPEVRGMDMVELEEETVSAVSPLSPFARLHVANILSTITSQSISSDPGPFHDEVQNEALQGLLKLLQGTVERGEGNSAIVTGPRGVGKTRTIARAIKLLSTEELRKAKTGPIIVKLSGHVQTNDRLAIREMGRQIAEAEGVKAIEGDPEGEQEGEGNDTEEYAPTTLPSHLLALLTAPSPRAIIIVMEEFDLFTEHARQALLYCLLDVVQSIKTGPVESTGRGVAVIGVTSRVDTLLLLEKRVKSRFSHRQWRITSPLSTTSIGWTALLRQVLVPWPQSQASKDTKDERKWKLDWEYAVDMLMGYEKIKRAFDRLSGLTTDVRNLYRPFAVPLSEILGTKRDFISVPQLAENILVQVELAGWGLNSHKLKGLPHPALGILIIAKHLHYAGREEFNFAQVEEEYLRFARTKLVGIGKTRWPIGLLRTSFDHLLRVSLLTSASNSSVQPRFAKVRCTLSPHEVVGWFKGEGANILGPELTSWGRVMGGHV